MATVSAMANFTNCINLSVRNRRAFSRIVCTNRAPVKSNKNLLDVKMCVHVLGGAAVAHCRHRVQRNQNKNKII